MSDHDYSFWQRSLAGDRDQVVNLNKPCAGFWRMDRRHAVAIWRADHGNLVCLVGGQHWRDPVQMWARELEPITEDLYRRVVDGGENWPDLDEIVAEQRHGIGGNKPPDEIELLKEQIDSASQGVDSYAEIKDDDALKAAQSLRARLNELGREADKKREELKRPHLEAGKAIDQKWQPIVKAAKAAADTLASYISKRLTAVAKAEAEERRKAEAERLRQEAEARERDATLNAPDAPPPPAEPEPSTVPTQIRGAYGRAANVKTVTVITEVEDYDALYQHFKADDDVRAVLRKKAERAVANGNTVPGVKTEQQKRVA